MCFQSIILPTQVFFLCAMFAQALISFAACARGVLTFTKTFDGILWATRFAQSQQAYFDGPKV